MVGYNNVFINRDVERALFRSMLISSPGTRRVLAIGDQSGHGKSSLLRKLRDECDEANVPACLIELGDKQIIKSDFDLIDKIRDEFNVYNDVKFEGYDRLNHARLRKDIGPFINKSGSDPAKDINASGANLNDDAKMIGNVENYYDAENIHIHSRQNPEWPSAAYEDKARKICIDAFFEDVKKIDKASTIVILLDAWDKCDNPLQRWISMQLLSNLVLAKGTVTNVVAVVAGIDLAQQLITRKKEDVHFIDKLSEWDFEHMKALFESYGYFLKDSDIETLRLKVNKGDISLIGALQVAKIFSSRNTGSV